MRLSRALFLSLLGLPMCSGLFGQEVVSARSGMVHFTQGQVLLDDHVLDRKAGSFPLIKEGATLRTEKGRAEILLTPGAMLRLDENSSIRMISTELADTRLTFVSGSAILDLSDSSRSNSALTITYKDARVQFPKSGVYRLDADTGVLQVYSGEAEVTYDGQKTIVDPSHLFFCWLGLETDKLGNGTEDEFYDWASDRNQVISEENQLAQDTGHDPGDSDGDPDAQFGAGGSPYSGVPYAGGPSLGAGPAAGPQVYPYSTYAMGGAYFNPFNSYVGSPFFPFGYPALVVVRPYRNARPLWPHSASNPIWHPVTAGSVPLSPILPTRIGTSRVLGAGAFHPISIPRPAVGSLARPSTSVAAHVGIGHR